MKRTLLILSAWLFLCMTLTSWAGNESTAPALNVGDLAPPLHPGKWVRGPTVAAIQTGNVTVVFFWATWSAPSAKAIPRLSHLATNYMDKGCVVIGLDAWEENDGDVAPFLKMIGGKIKFPVALDDKSKVKDGLTAQTWLKAAGLDALPTVFVIGRDAKIAWIGFSGAGLDGVVASVIAGTFDAAKQAATDDDASKPKLIQKLTDKLAVAATAKMWDAALGILDELEKTLPAAGQPGIGLKRFGILLQKNDAKAVQKIAADLGAQWSNSVPVLNELAWGIATADSLTNRDLALADRLARRACDVSKNADANALDTLARIQFMIGQKEEAIATQKAAVAKAEADDKDDMAATLKSYQAGELPPVPDDDDEAEAGTNAPEK